MAKKNDDFFTELTKYHWSVSVIFSVVLFLFMRYIVTLIPASYPIWDAIRDAMPSFAWFSLLFLLPGLISFLNSLKDKRILKSVSVTQSGNQGRDNSKSIDSLNWREFERLLCEAFRQIGFQVEDSGGQGADGGIDLVLHQQGKRYLVQCKQWRKQSVGVKVVREMFGVLHHENAAGVIIVTSGRFTKAAEDFAEGKKVKLIEGRQLAEMIAKVQHQDSKTKLSPVIQQSISKPDSQSNIPPTKSFENLQCPQCSSNLVQRVSKRGPKKGTKFWGCETFPKCRFTQDI